MTKFYCVTFDANFADEFDCRQVTFMTDDQWQYWQEEGATDMFNDHADGDTDASMGFGGNDQLEFETYKEFIDCFNAVEVSESTYNEMSRIFHQWFGTGPL